MRKYILLTFMLSACSMPKPYQCQPLNFTETGYWGELCLAHTDLEYLSTKKYNDEQVIDFVNYLRKNFQNKGCFLTNNKPGEDYFVTMDKERIDNENKLFVCNPGIVEKYENAIEQERLEEEEKLQKNKEKVECEKILQENRDLRKHIKTAVNDTYKKAINLGAVQLKQDYIDKVAACLTCIYDEFNGDKHACSVARSGGDLDGVRMEAQVIMYRHLEHCRKFYLGDTDFNPCEWAKDLNR